MPIPSMSTLLTFAVFAAIAAAAWWWLPAPRIVTIPIACLIVALGPPLWIKARGDQQLVERLTREGLPGTAKILHVESTNVLVRDRPQVRVQLRVELPGRPAYEAQLLVVPPYGQSAVPDRIVPVQVDPADPQQMLIDWTRAPPAPPAAPSDSDLAERLKQLDSLRRQNLISAEEYEAQRQRLLSEL